jgi:hypothetical protein
LELAQAAVDLLQPAIADELGLQMRDTQVAVSRRKSWDMASAWQQELQHSLLEKSYHHWLGRGVKSMAECTGFA